MKSYKILSVAAGLLFLQSEVYASVITTVTRAEFQAAVSGGAVSFQNFDSLVAGSTLGTLGGVTYGASGGTPLITSTFLTTTSPNGLGSTSVGYFLPTEQASFTFSSAISAFAIDINTFAATEGAYSALLSSGDTAFSIHETFPNTTTGQFLGFVSDTPFTSLTLGSITGFSYTLDTLVWGDAASVRSVPEPAVALLLGIGMVGLALARRRRAMPVP